MKMKMRKEERSKKYDKRKSFQQMGSFIMCLYDIFIICIKT